MELKWNEEIFWKWINLYKCCRYHLSGLLLYVRLYGYIHRRVLLWWSPPLDFLICFLLLWNINVNKGLSLYFQFPLISIIKYILHSFNGRADEIDYIADVSCGSVSRRCWREILQNSHLFVGFYQKLVCSHVLASLGILFGKFHQSLWIYGNIVN